MELLLWRWSTAVQVSSAALIAVFFLVLSFSVRRVETRPLAWAWLANLAALVATVAFWFLQPDSDASFLALRAIYFAGKTTFVVLLVVCAASFARSGGPGAGRWSGRALLPVVPFALVAALVASDIATIGVVQSSIMAVGCALAATWLLRHATPGGGWMVIGFVVRAALAVVETVAYATQVMGMEVAESPGVSDFIATHSAFDTGAEWMIALGCVLALHESIQRELRQTNEDLRATQRVLQGLVDRDPLTGLANRRSLSAVLRAAWSTGATLLFFDLDDFKEINDRHGHRAGDGVLMRFAEALTHAFRPGDHVLRYAGDEFVVVAPSVEPDRVLDRIHTLRDRLEEGAGPRVTFTVGHAYLPVEGDAEAALEEADAAMYALKKRRARRLRPSSAAPRR